jgi:heme/copper-type cytochrome/quinol oxidase subunit 3
MHQLEGTDTVMESRLESQSAIGQSAVGIPSSKLGMWVFLSGEVLIFGGLIITCVLFRLSYPQWHEFSGETNALTGSINTFVLITGSFTIVLAHKMVDQGNLKSAYLYIFLTIISGLLFLAIKAIEYAGEIEHGYNFHSGPFWAFYYGLTGFHAVHVFTGTVINTVVLILISRRKKPGNPRSLVENAGLFWHFVDIVWVFLLPLFYLS